MRPCCTADGIERRALKEKRFGVFDCRLVADHPMTEHFPQPLWVPHSRYNDLPEAGAGVVRLQDSRPARRRPASIPSPSRTAASFCSSRAIRNTRPIRCCANTAATSARFLERRARGLSGNAARLFQRRRRLALAEAFRDGRCADRRSRAGGRVSQRPLSKPACNAHGVRPRSASTKNGALSCSARKAERRSTLRGLPGRVCAGPGAIGRSARARWPIPPVR